MLALIVWNVSNSCFQFFQFFDSQIKFWLKIEIFWRKSKLLIKLSKLFVPKLTYFSGEKVAYFEFSRLNLSEYEYFSILKIVILDSKYRFSAQKFKSVDKAAFCRSPIFEQKYVFWQCVKSKGWHTSGRLSSTSQSTEFTMFHDRSAHPVDLGIPSNSLMEGIDHDDLEVLVSRILANP